MSKFDSSPMLLSKLMAEIVDGKVQLPDFQRGWVWDDEHIRSLLVSIARDFPIGSIMLLETGGDARFQIRPIEGVVVPPNAKQAEKLILDGQQRLTSLTQVLMQKAAVQTRDEKKKSIERFYYINIEKTLDGMENIDEAIICVDKNKRRMTNFGRDVVLDLSTPEMECNTFHFPCNQILNSNAWELDLHRYAPEKFGRYMDFREIVINRFREYHIALIELKKENPKEAVCLVFEKVNTGGMPLSVFELVTASYAADNYNLRDEWYGNVKTGIPGIKKQLEAKVMLTEIQPTDFLQGVCLLSTLEKRQADLAAGKTPKEATMVSAKREHVLAMRLDSFRHWAPRLLDGFLQVDRFLSREGFQNTRYLPYRTQLIPLAAIMVHLGDRWLEPVIYDKLQRWFWCGVLGELYGGAVETRIALDLQGVLEWVIDRGEEPKTVTDAGFQPSRLDSLRTRTSAAYRGLYTLLQREGSQDFFWKTTIKDLDREDCLIDIHHIFPQDWCKKNSIGPAVFNSIINKTALSYKANRKIGGNAPSIYLRTIAELPEVRLATAEQDAILATHLIDPALLRADKFREFYEKRRQALLELVERAMGKAAIAVSGDAEGVDDDPDEYEDFS